MDPDENLKTQLRLAKSILASADAEEDPGLGHPRELAEHVEALHGWLMSGGFLPTTWETSRLERASWVTVVAMLLGQVIGAVSAVRQLSENIDLDHQAESLLRSSLVGMVRARVANAPLLVVRQGKALDVTSPTTLQVVSVPLSALNYTVNTGEITDSIGPLAELLYTLLGPLK